VASDYGMLFMPIKGIVDVEEEVARLTKQLEKIEQEIKKVQAKLSNPSFRDKVPAEVLEEHEQREKDWETKKARILAALDALGS